MAFAELLEGIKKKLPRGASERYARLETLERMLDGRLYDEIRYSFEQEKAPGRDYIPIRERRPSVDFNLAYEITQDTQAELFGDEQFPQVQVVGDDGQPDDDATKQLAELINEIELDGVVFDAYEAGVCGSVAVIIHKADNGTPFYEIIPGKFCEPAYRSDYSKELLALTVTYPIKREEVEDKFPEVLADHRNDSVEWFWYRYIIGPWKTIDYFPLSDADFEHLGEKDDQGHVIEFKEIPETRMGKPREHGWAGVTPAAYVRNLGGYGGRQRDLDGPALWWPIRNICIELDYTLSQAGRGLRYSADPMLFVNTGDMMQTGLNTMGGAQDIDEAPAGNMATQTSDEGGMVKGVGQTLVARNQHADAKILEISAQGIKEEREFARDLREMALEVVGGMKARAEHQKGQVSGAAMDKSLKPLRRVVRRQRRPFGRGLLLTLIELTLIGFDRRAIIPTALAVRALPPFRGRRVLDWPNDDVLQGQELYWHALGCQIMAGGSGTAPKELISPEASGQKLASDVGFHEPYDTIKGSGEPPALPEPTKPSDGGASQ